MSAVYMPRLRLFNVFDLFKKIKKKILINVKCNFVNKGII